MTLQTQQVLVLTASEINRLLPMEVCVELMAGALMDLSKGDLFQPLRTVVRPPGARGVMAMMPAYRPGDSPTYGLKAIGFFHDNPRLGKDAHHGCVLLSSGETGELLAMMNASAITALRTAAVSAVATDLLARSGASELAIVGSGIQARAHLLALSKVRSLRRARIVSVNPDHPKQLADEMENTFSFPIEPVTSIPEALNGADIIVTATSSRQPVIKRKWITAGAHINAIGTYSREAREIDGETMAAARLYVDRRDSTLNEAGDFLIAEQEGFVTREDIQAEIGEVLLGQEQGRTSENEITLFKSLGLAVEDLACAEYLYEQARVQNVGTMVQF